MELPEPNGFSFRPDDLPVEDALDTEIREFFKAENINVTEQTESVGNLVKDILLHERAVAGCNEDIKAKQEERLAIDKRRAELLAEYELLGDARKNIETELFKLRSEKNRLTKAMEDARKRLQMALDQLRKTAAWASAIAQYDSLTQGLYWRDFAFTLQLEGAQLLTHAQRAILGDDMGLGKTLTLLIALDMSQAKKVLIVCPADVTDNFAAETRMWTPHRTVINMYKMDPVERGVMLQTLSYLDDYVVLINYDSWRKDRTLPESFVKVGFDTVITDEGHNIKNPGTSAFKGIEKIVLGENTCPRCHSTDTEHVEFQTNRFGDKCKQCKWTQWEDIAYDIADRRSVKRFWFATGTPILNKPEELFTALHLMLPEIFTDIGFFRRNYCKQDHKGNWIFSEEGTYALSHHLSGRMIVRKRAELKKEGVEIPEPAITIHNMDIDKEAYPLQWQIIHELNEAAEFILTSGHGMTMSTKIELILRQRQANIWPGGINLKDEDGNVIWSVGDEVKESIKMDWAVKMLDEFTMSNNRCVMFSQFSQPLHEIDRRLKAMGIRSVVFDGSTPDYKRQQIKKDFDKKYCEEAGYETKWDVVLCNYKTGGVGLNFTGATHMVICDEEWNPGKNQQAWYRIARIGQDKDTFIHILRLNKTIDAWFADLLKRKQRMVENFDEETLDLYDEMLNALRGGEFL